MEIIYGYTHPHPAEDYCIYCDSQAIKDEAYDMATEMAAEALAKNPESEADVYDFLEQCEEEAFSQYTMCRSCYNED